MAAENYRRKKTIFCDAPCRNFSFPRKRDRQKPRVRNRAAKRPAFFGESGALFLQIVVVSLSSGFCHAVPVGTLSS